MRTLHCDGCGKQLEPKALRYTVRIDVQAAHDEMEVGLLDLVRDHRAELLELIDRLKDRDAREVEEGIHKSIKLDLCPSCQRVFVRNPLRFHPEQTAPPPEVDIDAFLRSLRPKDDDSA